MSGVLGEIRVGGPPVGASLRYPVIAVRPLGAGEFGYLAPGMNREVRVTTRADYFDDHADSMELWSPGAPCFSQLENSDVEVTREHFQALIG